MSNLTTVHRTELASPIERIVAETRAELRQTMRRFAFAPVAGNSAALVVILGLYSNPDWNGLSKAVLSVAATILLAGLSMGALTYAIEPFLARLTSYRINESASRFRLYLLSDPRLDKSIDEAQAQKIFDEAHTFERELRSEVAKGNADAVRSLWWLGLVSAVLFMIAIGLTGFTIVVRDFPQSFGEFTDAISGPSSVSSRGAS